MTKLIGFSGAHCTGKSATLDLLAHAEIDSLYVDDFKVSRFVLAESGLTLEQATETPASTQMYQSYVLREKIAHEANLLDQSEYLDYKHIIVDRTPADIYAYTRLWAEKHNINPDWLKKFKEQCADILCAYDKIFLFPAGVFPFVDDGIRAKEETQKKIALYIEEFLCENYFSHNVIQTVSIEDRANEVLKIINQ